MPEHPNAVWVSETWNAAVRGDASAADRLADDIEWHEIGLAEPIVGRAAVLAHLAARKEWQGRPILHDVLASDEHAAILIRARATRGGRTFEYRVAEVYDLRDGKVVKRWAVSDDTSRIAEFFR